MQQVEIEVVFVGGDEFFKVRLMMSGEQLHPRGCDGLVIEMRHA